MKALVLALLFLFIAVIEAKQYSRCEFARLLKRSLMDGYHGYSLGNWICMAYHESGFKTHAVNINDNGSRDYGIFQINSRYWCNNNQGRTKNGCRKPCSDFLNDDITDDIACAKKIVHDKQKMNAWRGWQKHCQGRDLSKWTQGCNL
ncbi:lysozyme C milk isozyme-like [Crotalus adamanteus]|uniref:Lysozyme C milk isozyme-like n=1 Tax=Crotalus adamanteus TaxID=8729 RepID=A0AAW1C1A8_CROAD